MFSEFYLLGLPPNPSTFDKVSKLMADFNSQIFCADQKGKKIVLALLLKSEIKWLWFWSTNST